MFLKTNPCQPQIAGIAIVHQRCVQHLPVGLELNFILNFFRLILANKSSVPLNNVLPVIFNNLPLKEDQVIAFSLQLEALRLSKIVGCQSVDFAHSRLPANGPWDAALSSLGFFD